MYNDVIMKSIEKFSIYYKGEKIKFSSFDKSLINVFLNEKENINVYIMPKDNVYFIALFIIYTGLLQYLDNIYSEGNNLIDEIEQGDILEFSKARCEFLGIEDNKMKLNFADLLYCLPIEQVYKVSFYKGNANTLSKYPSNSNRGTKKTRNIISQILEIDNDAFSKVISSSTLIVAQKDNIFSIMENVKIQFNSEMLDIGEIFPVAYCQSEENYYHFRGNSSKQEPIIKFTSKIYNAKDIVKKNKKITSVIILQNKINREDIEDISYISKRSNISKIRTILQPLEIERYMDDTFLKENFNIINMNEEFFQKILPQDINTLNKHQYRLFKNYANATEKHITIKDDSQDVYRKNILKKCSNLIRIFEDDIRIVKFVISARTLSKRLSSMIMPLQEYENFYESKNLKQYTIKSVLEELKVFCEGDFFNSLSDESKSTIIDIYNNSISLYERIVKVNDKWNELETIIRLTNNQRIGIVVENKNIRKVFRKYFKTRYPLKSNIYIESMKDIKESVFDRIIYTSRLDENYYWNYQLLNSSNNIFILSRSEKNNLKYLKRKYIRFIKEVNGMDITEDDVLLSTDKHDEQVVSYELEVIEENNLNNNLDMLIATSYIPLQQSTENSQAVVTCELVLTFLSGEKAFITPQYETYVLNESREELINKKARNIEKGDILLFIEAIEKDLIDNIMVDLLKIKKIEDKYKEDYETVIKWKSELKSYINNNNITFKELESRLKEKGISRSSATIGSWLRNTIVGPQEEDVLKALGEITFIDILLKKYDQCFSACSNIRKFQILIRKSIARCILKSWINEENSELDLIIINRIEKAMNYIRKVEVQNIYLANKEVPMYLANRIITE